MLWKAREMRRKWKSEPSQVDKYGIKYVKKNRYMYVLSNYAYLWINYEYFMHIMKLKMTVNGGGVGGEGFMHCKAMRCIYVKALSTIS